MELRIGYFKKDKTIYFRDYHSVKWFNYSSWELKDVDKKSFRKVTKRFAKDKDHVYYEGVLVEGCDPNSAELVKKHYGYIKDKNHVFYRGKILSNEPENFQVLLAGYSKDSRLVYNYSSPTKYAYDALSFGFF